MTPEQIADNIDDYPWGVVPYNRFLEQACQILEKAIVGEDILHEGKLLVDKDVWRFDDEIVIHEIAMKLEARGKIEKDESEHLRIVRRVADKVIERANEHGFLAELISTGDVHEHPLVVEIQVGKNRLFVQSQWITVTIYDSDDMTVELPDETATLLGRGNTIIKDKPSALESILNALEGKAKEAQKERPPTKDERQEQEAERREGKVEDAGRSEEPEEDQPEGDGMRMNKLNVMQWVRKGTKPPRMGGTFAPH